jgi:hypothetical protein
LLVSILTHPTYLLIHCFVRLPLVRCSGEHVGLKHQQQDVHAFISSAYSHDRVA